MDDDVRSVRERHAKRFLSYFRKLLAQHDTHRHVITISAGMGSYGLVIDGKNYYPNETDAKRFPIIASLQEIEENMDWDWVWCLDKERLN